MEKIPAPGQLREEEFAMLKAFVESPVYPIFIKLIEQAISAQHRLMEMQKDTHALFNLQGRINGMRYCQNAPKILIDGQEDFLRRRQEADEISKHRGPRT